LLDARPADGWVRIGFDGKPQFCNPAGFIQGGILGAMLDDTMGPAVFVMTDGRLYTATITMTVNFLAPARPGPLVGEAHVTQFGKSIAFVEGRLMGEDGTVLATATTSARLVDAAKAIPGPAGAVGSIATPHRSGACSAVIAVVLAFVRVWRERRSTRRQLAVMSERELQDMGICRPEIANEIGKPFWRALAVANAVR
jgi:uncharacterized protein (TIGR00369 family)